MSSPRRTSQKMSSSHNNVRTPAGVDAANRKVLVLVFMLFLHQLACDAHVMSECCSQSSRACRLYLLLCRSGGSGPEGKLTGDAAAGILTLGKRTEEEEERLQSRLRQLLHGSRNQAAGILTVGKRTEGRPGGQYVDWATRSGTTITTPVLS